MCKRGKGENMVKRGGYEGIIVDENQSGFVRVAKNC